MSPAEEAPPADRPCIRNVPLAGESALS